jgi:hypothetical protein
MKRPPGNVTRASALVAVTLFLAIAFPPRVPAQEIRAVGGHLGRTSSRQVFDGALKTDERRGLLLGAFVEVATPLDWLSVIAEASYVQRGGEISLEAFGLQGQESVETKVEYISFPVVLSARFFRNPIGIYAYVGPAVDYYLNVQGSPMVSDLYTTERTTLTGVVGGGVELLVAQRWSLRLEARLMEGLTAAFDGRLGEIRHRSFELFIRAGVRPRSTRPPR